MSEERRLSMCRRVMWTHMARGIVL